MQGNPTAGILLLVLASLLIVLGVTDKGKKILAILLNKESSLSTASGSGGGTQKETTKDYTKDGKLNDSAAGAPNYNNSILPKQTSTTPGSFVGEKGAAVI